MNAAVWPRAAAVTRAIEETGFSGVITVDAGVSFRSAHDPRTHTTVTVISNTAEGAWPIARAALPD